MFKCTSTPADLQRITKPLVQPQIQSLFSLMVSDRNPISQLAPLSCFFSAIHKISLCGKQLRNRGRKSLRGQVHYAVKEKWKEREVKYSWCKCVLMPNDVNTPLPPFLPPVKPGSSHECSSLPLHPSPHPLTWACRQWGHQMTLHQHFRPGRLSTHHHHHHKRHYCWTSCQLQKRLALLKNNVAVRSPRISPSPQREGGREWGRGAAEAQCPVLSATRLGMLPLQCSLL